MMESPSLKALRIFKFFIPYYLFFTFTFFSCAHRLDCLSTNKANFNFTATHIVMINNRSDKFLMKGFFAKKDSCYILSAENEIGMDLFVTTWNSKKLYIKPASEIVKRNIKFDMKNIAIDIWRIFSEWSVEDINGYNKNNSTDIPEDNVLIKQSNENIAMKMIYQKSKLISVITYEPSTGKGIDCIERECKILFKNFLYNYEISIIQKPAHRYN